MAPLVTWYCLRCLWRSDGYDPEASGHRCPTCRSSIASALIDPEARPPAFKPRWVAGPRPGEAMWMDAPHSYTGCVPITDPRVVNGEPYVPAPYDGLSAPGVTPFSREILAVDVRGGNGWYETDIEPYADWLRRHPRAAAADARALSAGAPPPAKIVRPGWWRRFLDWFRR